jgi:hypothetical protein
MGIETVRRGVVMFIATPPVVVLNWVMVWVMAKGMFPCLMLGVQNPAPVPAKEACGGPCAVICGEIEGLVGVRSSINLPLFSAFSTVVLVVAGVVFITTRLPLSLSLSLSVCECV